MSINGIRISALFVFAVVLLGGWREPQDVNGQTADPVARPAKIVVLEENTAGLRRTYPGTLAALKQADLAFRVSGQLIELPSLAGDRVEAGDLLARLDPTDFRNTRCRTAGALRSRQDTARSGARTARKEPVQPASVRPG